MASKNDELLDQMRQVIGMDAFKRLIGLMPGERLRIPTYLEWDVLERRNQAIRDAYRSGQDIPKIQERYPLSHRQILRIANEE